MPVEVGSIVNGKVASIKAFGAFINLPEGKSGLCHISEIADGFVNKVEDHLEMNQEVQVKVIKIDENGKISLSIKKVNSNNSKSERTYSKRQDKPSYSQNNDYQSRRGSQNNDYQSRRSYKAPSLDDMITDFMKNADEKQKSSKTKKSRRGNGFNTRK